MSGAPKRLLEDGGHSATSKRPHEENSPYSNLPGKSTPSFTNEYRLPFEAVSDGRMAKIPRHESRDVDSRHDRSFRLPSPANGSCLVLPGSSESRLEVRDLKDSRDAKLEARESKGEARELYTEARLDVQSSKIESDVRPDCRGDDKELRFERDFRSDVKYDIKYEKDSVTPATSHFNCKEQKEHPRSKRYSESSGDVLDPWRVPQHSLQAMDESDKPIRTGEGRESWEAHEAIGESKIELKGEDKNKEKDRKRKDEKYRDWGEREKDRNDRHSNLHLGSSTKESTREDRDTERWDRMRKDSHKIREGKERDKDPFKKPPSNVNEKEPLQILKDHTDNFVKTSEQVNIAIESKRTKEPETWKGGERDTKDRKKERDQDAEIEKHDKQIRGSEKELVDGCAEGDGVTVREREMFCYGVQQGRRMMRQRGSSQVTSREPRPRSRSRESEVSQEKAEVSTIVYKVGECMQEILKAWKEFQATNDYKRDAHLQNGPTLEIRIPAEHVTATNRQVRGGQLWGTDIYTDDSDLVAVLMHTGYCRPTASPPPSAIYELWATIRVLPPQDCYTSTLRNNVRSRAWGAGISCSFRVERCCIVKKGGGTIDLEPRLNHISAVEPTLAPVSIERTMTTRSAASNAMRQQKFVREVTIQYNLCNEPWLKYSISVVADKGLKKPMYTSARLKKGEVLYLETHFQRYELCFSGERIPSSGTATLASAISESSHGKTQHHIQNGDRNHERDHVVDLFRWSRCKKPLPQKLMRSIGIPLPTEHLEVLEDNLEWEDVQWSQTGVWIAGKEYVLARAHFLSSV